MNGPVQFNEVQRNFAYVFSSPGYITGPDITQTERKAKWRQGGKTGPVDVM